MRIALLLVMLLSSTVHAEEAQEQGRQWTRLVLETAGLFAIGQAWYWRDGRSTNSGDWELPGNWSAIDRKLTGDGFRFDGDGFVTNAVKHPLFGATAFELARENGFGLAGAFAMSTLASGAWEVFGEWREFGSINDMLTTSTAGVPLGETLHQIAHHLRRTHFELYAGAGDHRELGRTRGFDMIGLRGELDLVPGRGMVADTEGFVTDGRHVGFSIQVPFDREGVRARDVAAKTAVLGYYRSRIARDVDGELDGFSLFAGVDAAFDYHQILERPGGDTSPDNTWDLLATVATGPALELDLHRGGFQLHAALDATVDFAMIKSWAFDRWRAMHPDAVVRGALQTNPHAYYYAAGVALAPQLAASYRGVSLGVALGGSAFSSLDGHDRYRDMLTMDPHLDDSDTSASAWLRADVHGVLLELDAHARHRASRIEDVTGDHREGALMASVGYRL
jgi:hypothetical protein